MRAYATAVLVLAITGPLTAATLTVDDDGPADYNNIQAALAAAAPGDTIAVADGVYTGTGNRALDPGGKQVVIRSVNGPARCLIDCGHRDRAFSFQNAETPSTMVCGFTIRHGQAQQGGAILCVNRAAPTIRNCILRDNCANDRGGAISCEYDTTPIIDGCLIHGNVADSSGGGVAAWSATVTLTGCTISRNSSRGDGGGLSVRSGQARLTDCTLARNQANGEGGGAYCNQGTVTFINSIFTDNTAGVDGGALWLRYDGTTALVTNCTFRGNAAGQRGGGIYCNQGVKFTATNSIFASHTPYAVFMRWESELTFRNCLFHDNQPADYRDDMNDKTDTGGSQIDALSERNRQNISGDPDFALADDVRLVRGSACIDRGTNDPSSALPPYDADGSPRSIDGDGDGAAVADIGAFEYNPDQPVIAVSPVDIEFVKETDGTEPAPVAVGIRNAGGGTLNWRAACDAAWLSVEPATGTSSDQTGLMTLSVSTQGMAQGLHQTLLTLTDPQAVNDPRTLLVTLRIKGTLRVPQQYATIATALNAAMEGETVEIGPGTYSERLTLRQRVNLVGIDAPVIVAPPGRTEPAIAVLADGCLVDGFQIEGGSTGISIASVENTIANNTIMQTDTGLEVIGASGSASASHNSLLNNDVSRCRVVGLTISYSTRNILKDNRLHDNPENLRVITSRVGDYAQDIDTSNTLDGKPIYYLLGQSNMTIGAASNAGCIVAVECANLTISDLTLRHNTHGVLFVNTRNSHVERVVAEQNIGTGIRLENSPDNTLVGNQISACQYGISLYGSGGNTLQDNRMNDNEFNFACDGFAAGDYRQSITTSNRADGKPIYYLVDQAHLTLNRSTNAACVFAVDCSDIRVCDLTLQDNGAGITFVNAPLSTVENVVVRHNSLRGILLRDSERCTVRRCTVSDNYDGLYIYLSKGITLDGVRTCYNRQGMRVSPTSDPRITNCSVSANSNMGILLESGSTADILNCTIYNNCGPAGIYPESGGISTHPGVQTRIVNTIVWGNSPKQIATSTPVAVSYCDIQGGYAGEGNVDAAPLLTPDGHLCLGSPCIGKGRTRGDYPPLDVDGERRTPQGGIDIGADEYLDGDSDGLPDWWELGYFGDKAVADAQDDPDEDGHTNLVEYELYSSEPNVPAATYYVDAVRPDDSNDGLSWETAKKTIQAAIDLADNSDRIYVAPGVYEENITTLGRLVLLQGLDVEDPVLVADTVLAGTLTINTGETPGCAIGGLTLSNPNGTGLLCSGSRPTICNCLITGNRGWDWRQGGGVTLRNAAPLLQYCTISGNLGAERGAGIYSQSSAPLIRNCVIVGNVANHGYGGDGSALYLEQSNVLIENCTIAHNVGTQRGPSYSTYGSALWCQQSSLQIANSILWNPPLSNQVMGSESSVRITYSDVKGNAQPMPGLTLETGCIAVDPCFVAPGSWDVDPVYGAGHWTQGDYHLQSTGWRWTPYLSHGTHWVWDGQTSRCIDAGNPADPMGDEPTTVPGDSAHEWGTNVRIDMGAYGGTAGASMASPGWALRADINNDGIVNLRDFTYLGTTFATRGRQPADVSRDAEVDYADLARLADDWLRVTDWSRSKPHHPRP